MHTAAFDVHEYGCLQCDSVTLSHPHRLALPTRNALANPHLEIFLFSEFPWQD